LSEETVTFNLRVDASEAIENISDLNRLLTTYLSLARRAGRPEDLLELLSRIQQIRVAIQTLYRSVMLLYTATGPLGWAIGLGGLAMGGMMLADQMQVRRPRY